MGRISENARPHSREVDKGSMTAVTPGIEELLALAKEIHAEADNLSPENRTHPAGVMIKWAKRLRSIAAKSADEGVREATIEECAKVCDRWISSRNLHESLAATDIKRDIFRLSATPGAPKP